MQRIRLVTLEQRLPSRQRLDIIHSTNPRSDHFFVIRCDERGAFEDEADHDMTHYNIEGSKAKLHLVQQRDSGDEPRPAFQLSNAASDKKFTVELGSDDVCIAEPERGKTATLRLENDYANGSKVVLKLSFSVAMTLDVQPEMDGKTSNWEVWVKADHQWTKLFKFTQDSSSSNTVKVDLASPGGDDATGNKLEVTNESDDASDRKLKLVKHSLATKKALDVHFTYIDADVDDDETVKLDVSFSAKDNDDDNRSDPIFRIKSKPPKKPPSR